MSIHIDVSKNICKQIIAYHQQYMAEQMEKEISFNDAMDAFEEKMATFIDKNWKNKKFRNKLANDIIEIVRDDNELFKHLWEDAKPGAIQTMDETMDKYNKGKISKEEMEKELKFNSIIFEKIEEW